MVSFVTMESPLVIITDNSDRDLATAVVFFLLLGRRGDERMGDE